MLKERVAYLAGILCLFSVVNKSLAQTSYTAYSNIEVHTLRNVGTEEDEETARSQKGWNINFLSQPKFGLKSVQSGNKAIFVSQTQCEIYDFEAKEWAVKSLGKARRHIVPAATETAAYLAGGCTGPVEKPAFTSRVDIYYNATNSWKSTKLSEPRAVGAAATVGNLLVFAGGIGENGYTNTVDVYEVAANAHKVYRLSQPRTNMSVAVCGNKVLFIGGVTANGLTSNVIDILDVATGKLQAAEMPVARKDMSVAVANGIVLVAGGTDNNDNAMGTADIYNVATGEWQQMAISEARTGITTAVAGSKIYLAGGILDKAGHLSAAVDIYDAVSGQWSVQQLPATRAGMAVGQTMHKVLFAGGHETEEGLSTDRIEVLDIKTGEWETDHLFKPRMGMACVSYNNQIVFAGGTATSYPFPEYKEASGVVDIYTDPTVTLVSQPSGTELPCVHNNGKTYVYLDLSHYRNCAVTVTVLDAQRHEIFSTPVLPVAYQLQEVDVTALPSGAYQLLAEAPGYAPLLRRFTIKETIKHDDIAVPAYAAITLK